MERNEVLLRLQREFNDSAPNVRMICELLVQLGMENDLQKCYSLDDLKQLWLRIKSV
ncbi:MAG: hypothetical protein PHW04_17870 [Candidatus Wallbacteria bacterium]|nr:hypothetical protein [Candidatus Wallbacteria bacterium]